MEGADNGIREYDEIHDLVLQSPKIVQALHIVTDAISNGEKVVIFDSNVLALPIVAKFLNEFDIPTYIFSTHYEVKSRETQMAKFKASKEPCVLLSSVIMLAQGHNLPEANHVIIMTQSSNPTTYKQAIGRCHRYPQSKVVHVHYLFSSGLDRYMYELSSGVELIQDCTFDKLRELTEAYGVLP
jgi:SNF2 family DNA or RNA helicase